jgi:putative Mg2+ transporter-C (MgtC) family protein
MSALPTTCSIEFLGEVPIYFGLGIKVLGAMILGGLVGLDRERKMKSAGMKTNMLICLGAALYTAISHLMSQSSAVPFDPNRVGAQIVSGIGFLGAGTIIQSRGGVKGMTTAATIWVVAAIGMTVGAGYLIVATFFTLTVLVVLNMISPLYRLLEKEKDYKTYHVEILSTGSVNLEAKELIYHDTPYIHEMNEQLVDKELNTYMIHAYVTIHPRRIRSLVDELNALINVSKVHYFMTDRDDFGA